MVIAWQVIKTSCKNTNLIIIIIIIMIENRFGSCMSFILPAIPHIPLSHLHRDSGKPLLY